MCHPLHLSLLPNQPRQHLALAIHDFPPIFCIHCVQGVTNDYRYHEMYTLTVICELIFPGPCFCVNISINLNLQTTYFLVMFTRSFGFYWTISLRIKIFLKISLKLLVYMCIIPRGIPSLNVISLRFFFLTLLSESWNCGVIGIKSNLKPINVHLTCTW